ncbi:MAG: DUF99 family protein [Candidatus Bathyarchaeota archaeon]|nr:DUF99 family protein [Candidatus Bathyarchaeota archaeon]
MSRRVFRVVKPEIRVLGVDDSPFVFRSKAQTLVVGVVFRGGYWLEGAMSTQITVDGADATPKISSMIKASPHYKQLRVVMLNGVTFGGFNVVDIKALNAETNLPVLAVTDRKPDLAKVQSALRNVPDSEEKWRAVLNAGEIFPVVTRAGKRPLYVEAVGVDRDAAAEILRLTSTRSRIPEPLRVAHLVASGISLYIA